VQGYFTSHSDFFALGFMKIANQKNKIYCTARISKYFNTPSIGQLVNFALLTFSAVPIYISVLLKRANDKAVTIGFVRKPVLIMCPGTPAIIATNTQLFQVYIH
jgi:hypothetical protein